MTDGGERGEERRRFVCFSIEDGINYVGLKQTIPENQGLLQRGHSKSARHETLTTQRTPNMSARVLPRADLDPPRLRRSPVRFAFKTASKEPLIKISEGDLGGAES